VEIRRGVIVSVGDGVDDEVDDAFCKRVFEELSCFVAIL
jgi:hypothetical protein